MSQNPNIANLDAAQVANRVYDPTNDAVRVDVGSPEFVISGGLIAAQATISTSSSGVVLGPIAAEGVQALQVFIYANTNTAGSVVARIDVSPDPTSGTSVWLDTSNSTTLTASSSGTIVAGTMLTTYLPAQVQVTLTSNGLTGVEMATVYLVGNTF